ncbi:MAG TPA: tRNA (adenosine(37)-N6)-threonylcarbamoyltransferase complex dimerization subunit type 1 TsaB [Candidatus Eubacterium faecavium]|nr:tRNA (adenosine(37)-N6)-threonylcarbamoyltransferase complex dimerization subunit type 1 TsaB [Candidatus Eubacterium faecavium]
MLMLSVESSAVTASAALSDNGKILNSEFINNGLTHSETLLPLVEKVMKGYSFSSLDAVAVTAGPGSFTGVRIGVATVKGIAFPYDIPCIGVSTLEAIAYHFTDENAVICAVMDARRMQFYNALFKAKNGEIKRLCADRAIAAADLQNEIRSLGRVIIAGDGAKLFYDCLDTENAELAPEDRIYQSAAGVAAAAQNGKKISASALMPVYLRQSQAERELKLKKKS